MDELETLTGKNIELSVIQQLTKNSLFLLNQPIQERLNRRLSGNVQAGAESQGDDIKDAQPPLSHRLSLEERNARLQL